MNRSSVVGALTFATFTVTAASATAQTRVQAGILQCRGAPTASFIVGSVHELGCVFQSDRGPRYRYYGVVRRVGLDIGFTEQSAPAWAVFAPTHRIGPGDLSGNYGGVIVRQIQSGSDADLKNAPARGFTAILSLNGFSCFCCITRSSTHGKSHAE